VDHNEFVNCYTGFPPHQRAKQTQKTDAPSILGTTFLFEHNLILHFDPVKQEYYLEKQ